MAVDIYLKPRQRLSYDSCKICSFYNKRSGFSCMLQKRGITGRTSAQVDLHIIKMGILSMLPKPDRA